MSVLQQMLASSASARVPDAPTIGTAVAGNASATVTFTPPASNGGSAITNYSITTSPGTGAHYAASSPATVTGLVNGTQYNFVVAAINAIGTGAYSAWSNFVTPAVDITPDAFSFTNQTNVAQSTWVTSNIVTITGLNAAASVTISSAPYGSDYSINGGAWTNSGITGSITNGQTLNVRVSTNSSEATLQNISVTVGTYTTTWSVTTRFLYAWSNSASMSAARSDYIGFGTASAASAFSNDNGGLTGETFNGTSWAAAAGSVLMAAGYAGACGTTTAAVRAGGNYGLTRSEKYNGSAWSVQGSLNYPSYYLSVVGLQTAALAFGGYYSSSVTPSCGLFNGTAWSSTVALLTGRRYHAGCGTTTAATCFGGDNAAGTNFDTTSGFNGTTWSSKANLPNTLTNLLAQAGSASAALSGGGQIPSGLSAASYLFNGTAWSVRPNLTAVKVGHVTVGSSTVALAISGTNESFTSVTGCQKYS